MRTFRNITTGIVERVDNEYTIATMEASPFYEELHEQPATPAAEPAPQEVPAEQPQSDTAAPQADGAAELPTATAETPQA